MNLCLDGFTQMAALGVFRQLNWYDGNDIKHNGDINGRLQVLDKQAGNLVPVLGQLRQVGVVVEGVDNQAENGVDKLAGQTKDDHPWN